MTNEHVETVNSFGSASSTCSSASSASSSATSATSSSTSNESISGRPYVSELDLGLVFTDLKHLSNTLSLLARQIDQVVNIIDNKFGGVIASLDSANSAKRPVNFTKIINSSSCGHLLGTLNGSFKSRCNQCNQTLSPSKPESIYQHQPEQQPFINVNPKKPLPNKLNNEALLSNLLNASEIKTETRSVSDRKNNHQMHHNQQSSETTNSLKMKCPRSKSQPAFKETTGNFNNNNCQNNSPSNFHYPACSSNNAANLNKYLILEANRLTSSPICSFNNMNGMTSNSTSCNPNGDTGPIYSNMATSTIASQTGLLNDSSNAESSFYEDQLDNELESIVPNNQSKRPVPNQLCAAAGQKAMAATAATPPLTGLVTQPTPAIKTTQSNKQKSSNSNHHVSFNINNAIYTSRQDTPIPISILKPAQMATSINKANQIENGEKMCQQQQQQQQQISTLSSPLQSSLKKNQNLNGSDLEQSNKQCKQNKTVRIDSKTTIL